ncbi:hypothetical protein FRC11_007986 [Ceratobasidium sp. 423]|nr:hypothetical protein FRC11_007986 [Ceratobasidium sp. 423]
MTELPVLVSVPAAPSVATSGGPGPVGSTTARVIPNNLPVHIRQRNATVTRELGTLKSHLRAIQDDILTLQSTIIALQNRDEESKKEREDYAFRLKIAEAQTQYLQGVLFTYLESQVVRINNLGSATTMSELYGRKADTLSKEDANKATDIMNESLASLYGVTKFSPKEHGAYPKVSKAHLEWPSRVESSIRVPLHGFKWDESYNSLLNQPTFKAWVEHSIKHGPTLAGHLDLPSSVLDQRVMNSLCAKQYSTIKQQVMRYHGENKPKVTGIKQHGEGLDAPEPKTGSGNEAGEPFGDLANTGCDYQLYGDHGRDDAPLINPALLGDLAQVGGMADLQMPELFPVPSIPDSINAHEMPENANSVIAESQAKDYNPKDNIHSW